MTAIIVLALLEMVAQFLQTVTGFGSNPIVLSVGTHFYEMKRLVVLLVMVSEFQVLWLFLRNHKNIRWGILTKRIFPICLVFMPIGMYIQRVLDIGELKIILAIFIIGASSLELNRLFRTKAASKPLGKVVGSIVLATAALIHGMFTTGGPLMVYFTNREIDSKTDFRATMAAMWLVLDTVLLISYALTHRIDMELIKITGWVLPGVVVGIAVGEYVHHRVNELTFRKIVQIFLFISGLFLLV